MKLIQNQTFDAERALYHLQDAEVQDCRFAGPADGESAFKEAERITVRRCDFALRYPFWHTKQFLLDRVRMNEQTRAALWYAADGVIQDCQLHGVKCLRECDRITLARVDAVSPEFGWKCRDLTIRDSDITAEYCLLECKKAQIENLRMKGKYSFQYTEQLTLTDCVLDTKDAFWHAKNVTLKNCTVKGEYLAWYSDGLTLIDCHLSGTQPLCYCKNLKLIRCTMEQADLAFEYSDVEADIIGEIVSVKNPHAGHITADAIGEIITEDSVMENTCRITVR